MKNKQKIVTLTLVSSFLLTISMSSFADCADIKARYWRCTRASMIGEKCNESDNVVIPAECLNAGSEKTADEKENSPSSSTSSGFFESKKESKTIDYTPTELTQKKPVKIINIKPVGKVYFETEEEVDDYITKVKEDLLNAIKDGKKVRLQFN